jgi:hypothetical protein
LADRRLDRRLRLLLGRLGDAMGASIPLACQDWANTKAAYRFFSNERISEAAILAGHFAATRERFAAADGSRLGNTPPRSRHITRFPTASGIKRRRSSCLRQPGQG